MQRTPWVERKFTMDFPVGWIHNILERLYGTASRLTELVSSLSDEQLSDVDSGWSIKEHIGHLFDLEFLHIERIRQFKNRETDLTGADMSNRRTNESNHNLVEVNKLISDFQVERQRLINEFDALTDNDHYFESLHPRLKVKMRPIDLAYFTAEHDDHHLASIRILKRKFI